VLGWIILHDGDHYEPKPNQVKTLIQAPLDTLYWKVYCDEGKPSSGQYSLQALAQRYDEASKGRH
jgi:hypothetical protein